MQELQQPRVLGCRDLEPRAFRCSVVFDLPSNDSCAEPSKSPLTAKGTMLFEWIHVQSDRSVNSMAVTSVLSFTCALSKHSVIGGDPFPHILEWPIKLGLSISLKGPAGLLLLAS